MVGLPAPYRVVQWATRERVGGGGARGAGERGGHTHAGAGSGLRSKDVQVFPSYLSPNASDLQMSTCTMLTVHYWT